MSDVEFVNLTPHDIRVVLDDGREINIPASGTVARVNATAKTVDTINGVPVVRTSFGDVQGLPEPQEGRIYIVSTLVLQALGGQRNDVVAPDTGPQSVIRDESGRIVGIRRFQIL